MKLKTDNLGEFIFREGCSFAVARLDSACFDGEDFTERAAARKKLADQFVAAPELVEAAINLLATFDDHMAKRYPMQLTERAVAPLRAALKGLVKP